MKVRIATTVDIDPEAWDLAYGTGTKPADVRADVITSALDALHENFNREGFLIGGAI